MSDGTGWVGATAKQISRAVRRGDVSATQVVADTLEQIAISDPSLDAFRVIRGGAYNTPAEIATPWLRGYNRPTTRRADLENTGFRCAMTPRDTTRKR